MSDVAPNLAITGESKTIEDVTEYLQRESHSFLDWSMPQPTYKALLEAGGFFRVADNVVQSFDRSITEYVLKHPKNFRSGIVDIALGNVRPFIPLQVDPPRHQKFRKLLDPIFAPKRMDAVEPDIARRVNGLLDQFIDRGECNFTDEFAELYPSSVFLGLLGLPEEELQMFLRLRDGSLHPEKLDPAAATDYERRKAVVAANGLEIYDYFNDLIDKRTVKATDDIISGFLAAEIDGEKLTREEILDICFQLIIAGLDTVGDVLTCFYAYLATHPTHRQMIVDDPAVIPSAVEEMLRWETPVLGGVARMTQEDTELPNGETVCAGTAIVMNLGAANLDPKTCSDPFDVRFDREVNPHLAFGGGIHRCLGSHLARVEMRVALREWHRRIPEYWLKPGHETLEYYQEGIRLVRDLTLAWA